MRATITDINQRYSLSDKTTKSFLVLQLDAGLQFQVPVDDATLEAILRASDPPASLTPEEHANIEQREADRRREAIEHPYYESEDPVDHALQAYEGAAATVVPFSEEKERTWLSEETETVEWGKLADTQLAPTIRQILSTMGLPPVVTRQEFEELKLAITTRLANRPKVGKVDWNGGMRRPTAQIGRRTVPMDEAGNPMPPGGILEADPGETADEEEGVQQA